MDEIVSPEMVALASASVAAIVQLWTTVKEQALSDWKARIEERTRRPVDLSYFETLEGREYQARLWTAFLLTGDPRKRRGCLAAMLRMTQDDVPRGETMRTLVGLIAELDAFDYELVAAVVRLHQDPRLARHPDDQAYKLTEGDQLKGGVAYYRILNHVSGRCLRPGDVSQLAETEDLLLLNCHLLCLRNRYVVDSQGSGGGWLGAGPTDSEAIRSAWFAPTGLARSIATLVRIGLEEDVSSLPLPGEPSATDAGTAR